MLQNNEMLQGTKEPLPVHTILYLLYIVFIWLGDFLDLLCFAIETEQGTLFSRIVVLAIMVIGIFYVKKYVSLREIKINKSKLFIVSGIFVYAVVRGSIPDLSYDTSLAHASNMFPHFYGIFDDNAFFSEMSTYGLPLNDRMFYPAYLLFGYRLGTILNAIAVIASYLTVVDILYIIKMGYCKETMKFYNILKPEYFGFLIIFTFYISANIALYMVDALALPLLLEMLRIFLMSCNKEKVFFGPEIHLYFALLAGYCFAMKLTNVIYVFSLLVGYLLINRKGISLKVFLGGITLGVLPILIYMVYAYSITQNPVYPYYNEIFKSAYYWNCNFKDTRWGPQNLFEIIVWPIFSFIKPESRFSELAPLMQCSICVGTLSSFFLLIRSMNKKNKNLYKPFFITFLVMIYLWVITTGYARYIMFGEIWAGIIIWYLIHELKNSYKIINKFIICSCIFLLSVQFLYGQYKINYLGIEWAWRPAVLQHANWSNYIANMRYIFRDKGTISNEEVREKIDLLVQTNIYNNLIKMLYEGKPTVNLHALNERTGITEINRSYSKQMYDIIDQFQSQNKGIYTVDLNTEYKNTIDNLNKYGFKLKNAQIVESYFEPNKYVVLYEIEKADNYENNLDWICIEEKTYTIEKKSENLTLKGILAISPIVTWDCSELNVALYASDSKGNEKLVYDKNIEKLKFYNLNERIDLEGLEGEISFKFKCTTADGAQTIDKQFVNVINLQLNLNDANN